MQLNEDKFEYISGTSYGIKQLAIILACSVPLTVALIIFNNNMLGALLVPLLVLIAFVLSLFRLKKERKVAYNGEIAIARVDIITHKYKEATTTIIFSVDGHLFRFVAHSRAVNVKEGDCVRVKHLNYKYYVPEGNCGAGKFRIWENTI